MSYNGSGTFVINTAGQPVVSGTVISSTAFNALTADLATGLSTAITKDGQTTPTANIPMGSNKITGLAVGTAATDAANLSQVQSTAAKLVNSVSGVDTITGTMSPTLAAYAAGQMFYFVAAGDNTGAVTLNLDGLGAKSVTRDGSVALAAGDIKSGEVVVVVYDGTRFQVVSQLNSAGNATFANVSITSALNVGGVATFSGGTANGVTYLNGSKALTSGSALVFDGTNLGIGTSSPTDTGGFGRVLDIQSASGGQVLVRDSDDTTKYARFSFDGGTTNIAYIGAFGSGTQVAFISGGTAGTGEKMRLDSSGNLGLGVTPSAWGSPFGSVMQFKAGAGSGGGSLTGGGIDNFRMFSNAYYNGSSYVRIGAGAAAQYEQDAGSHYWYYAGSSTAGSTFTFTTAMRLDASGNLGVGTTSPSGKISVVETAGGSPAIRIQGDSSTNVGRLSFTDNGVTRTNALLTADNSGNLAFATNGTTERARITSGGEFLVGKASTALSVAGSVMTGAGQIQATVDGDDILAVNRKTNDGNLVRFFQDQTEEGNISVSGTTVSYNGGHLSRWSQTTDNTRIPLLKGTVMSNLDQMAVWEKDGEPLPNEQLNCMKVSDVEGDVNVAGVFVNWDNDDDEFANDMNVAMTGDMIIRIAQGVVVQRGDLLMSAGDGTAKPQGDDIIRSKTVAKVTSNHVTCTYEDGSYCVPCVLMAC